MNKVLAQGPVGAVGAAYNFGLTCCHRLQSIWQRPGATL